MSRLGVGDQLRPGTASTFRETFEEYLGTFLDKVYRASGALLDDSLVPDVVV